MALDPGILRLVKAIRQVESGGNFRASGGSGENGAYQFMPATWKAWAGEFLGDPNAPMTPINQNKVAYLKVEQLAKKGYKPAQIAAAWNGGEGVIAGDRWKTMKGTNKYGVAYDIPAYVSRVGAALKKDIPSMNVIPGAAAPQRVDTLSAVRGALPTSPTAILAKKAEQGNNFTPSSVYNNPFMTKMPNAPVASREPLQTQGDTGLKGVIQGIGKTGWQVATGVGVVGQKILDETLNKLGGPQIGSDIYRPGTQEYQQFQDYIVKKGTTERAAGAATEALLYALPASKVSGLTKAASTSVGLGAKAAVGIDALAQGGLAYGYSKLTGESEEDAKKNAAITAALTAAFPAIGGVISKIGDNAPKWLLKGKVISQTTKEIESGKHIEDYLSSLGWRSIGTQNQLIKRASSEIKTLSGNVNSILTTITKNAAQGGDDAVRAASVDLKSLSQKVADDIVALGGDSSAAEVSKIVGRVVPQVRKTVASGGAIDLVKANQTRQLIDSTLTDAAFLNAQLPYNKQVVRLFNSNLREAVKATAEKHPGGEAIRATYDELSKNIELRKALSRFASKGTGRQVISMADWLVGIAGGGLLGNPVAGVAFALAKNAAQSTVAKTLANQMVSLGTPLGRYIATLTPQELAVVLAMLKAIDGKENEMDIQKTVEDPQFSRVR